MREKYKMNSIKDAPRGTIVRPSPYEPKFRKRPHVDELLDDAYHVLAWELRSLRQKVESGEKLDSRDAAKAVRYAEAATKLMREEREQEKHADPEKLSDEELLAAAEAAKKILTTGTK
jgi:hypothetical protein